MLKPNVVDIAITGPVTVAQLREQLAKLDDTAIVCVGSCCGVHFYGGKPEVELARFKADDRKNRTVAVDYFPDIEQDPDDDELFGTRQKVVVLR